LKVIFVPKKVLNNIILVLIMVLISITYSLTDGYKYANVFLKSQREIPIYSVDTNEKKISLTFDVAQDEGYIDEILNILDTNNIKATFFIVGDWVDNYPGKVKEIYDKGHEIGNHSNSHPHFSKIQPEKMKQEILILSDKIKNITGRGTTLFRAPYGDYNNTVVKTVKETGHYCIQWDVDSIDWKDPGKEYIYNKMINNTGNGSILLFHNYAKDTPEVLDSIIKELKRKGFEFVKISDLIYKDNYYIDNIGRQKKILNN